MRHRHRKGRHAADNERIAIANREAGAAARRGDYGSMRLALRRINDIALNANLARQEHAGKPVHPMYQRQLILMQNARAAELGLPASWMKPIPPHPSRRQEILFARRCSG